MLDFVPLSYAMLQPPVVRFDVFEGMVAESTTAVVLYSILILGHLSSWIRWLLAVVMICLFMAVVSGIVWGG
ncbi:hypothetical protein A4G99_22645 [Haladaptatus sp. R4]|uniref:hypothetical protein n=1 Tax=Haladaptatus sp. R4 TaxID=1679489 RepID=UPI0007B47B94|nr:hypothetical protein [Haladaptatus sp. R4]KZN26221.1 hypothetical protein A4G99_22645 [Haladaptatus sp. R4]